MRDESNEEKAAGCLTVGACLGFFIGGFLWFVYDSVSSSFWFDLTQVPHPQPKRNSFSGLLVTLGGGFLGSLPGLFRLWSSRQESKR
jgi:hypothetical protein